MADILYFQMSKQRKSDWKRWKPQEASARLATRLNSSSYSLCLRHKYKDKYKCNHKDKYNAIAKTITELKCKYKNKTKIRIFGNTNPL